MNHLAAQEAVDIGHGELHAAATARAHGLDRLRPHLLRGVSPSIEMGLYSWSYTIIEETPARG
jgi:hypothetical protein